MKSRIAWVFLLLFCMAGTLFVALLGFEQIATSADEYARLQAELNVYSYVGIDAEALESVQRDVADSLRGGGPLYNREVALFGEQRPAFNEREMAHMEDVIRLFALERGVKRGAGIAAMACAIGLLLSSFGGGKTPMRRSRLWASTGFIALGVWLLSGLIFAAACGFDFEAAFVRFHEILFTNDLWQLDPRTSAMIRMYPAEFFMAIGRDIGIRMALWALGFAAVVFVVIYPWGRLKHGENSGD